MISLSKELGIKNESSTWATIIAICSKKGRHKLAEDYFDTMIESGVEPTMYTWTALVQNIARGIETFVTLSCPTHVSQPCIIVVFLQSCQNVDNNISAIVTGRGPDAALEQVDILKRTGVEPTILMFNTILRCIIDQNRLDDANNLWIRMHWEECSLDRESFTTMLKTCTKTGQCVETEIDNITDNMILSVVRYS